MKIEGACRVCGRRFPVDMIIAPPETAGTCPFCGTPLDREYHALLIESLTAMQRFGDQLETLIQRTNAVGENLEIDAESILAPLRSSLGQRAATSAARRAVAVESAG